MMPCRSEAALPGTAVDIPPKPLTALRVTDGIVRESLQALGQAHLTEAAARTRHDHALKVLKAAEDSAKHALRQQGQLNATVVSTLEVDDGAWDIDLEAGKLVRTDVES